MILTSKILTNAAAVLFECSLKEFNYYYVHLIFANAAALRKLLRLRGDAQVP